MAAFPPPYEEYTVPDELRAAGCDIVASAVREAGFDVSVDLDHPLPLTVLASDEVKMRAANIARLALGLPLWPDLSTYVAAQWAVIASVYGPS